jgi:hypothetical protein
MPRLSDTLAVMNIHGRDAPDPLDERDRDLIADITPDVMKCLAEWKFFEELDDRLCPADQSKSREDCHGNFEISEVILRSSGRDDADFADIFGVLRAQGGFCDCEILYNVSQKNRLKSEYWRAQSARQDPPSTQSE